MWMWISTVSLSVASIIAGLALKYPWLWILTALFVLLSLIFFIRYRQKKRNNRRIGIDMEGGRGVFRKTKISGQDISIKTKNTNLEMKNTKIK